MQIKLIPQYRNDELHVSRTGDVLTISDEPFDFGPLQAGATLPAEAIGCQWIVGPVERDDAGVLHLSLLLPIQKSVFHDALPDIIDPPDGPIDLPVIKEPEVAQ